MVGTCVGPTLVGIPPISLENAECRGHGQVFG